MPIGSFRVLMLFIIADFAATMAFLGLLCHHCACGNREPEQVLQAVCLQEKHSDSLPPALPAKSRDCGNLGNRETRQTGNLQNSRKPAQPIVKISKKTNSRADSNRSTSKSARLLFRFSKIQKRLAEVPHAGGEEVLARVSVCF